MPGVLDGIKVLDLSWGIAGPMAGMLLADHGASVTKIEPPSGDPFRGLSGYTVWQRGKRSAVLDLRAAEDLDCFLALARGADVVLESFTPGVTERLGIDYESLRPENRGLVYCSITGYGPDGDLAGRPGYDALVAARSGQLWEVRGVPGTTLATLAGIEDPLADAELPQSLAVGPDRPGPLFPGVPWTSLGAFYLAALGISAALRARELTGNGQRVETSLLQGAMATTVYAWQRTASAGDSGFMSWVPDPRSPKGFHRCADGRWIHQWTPLPSFFLESSHGDRLEQTDEVRAPRNSTWRAGLDVEATILLTHFRGPMSEAVARFPSEEWVRFAAQVDVPLQPVRSPEEALDDPALLADGCVVELSDHRLGAIRQVGRAYSLSACPAVPTRGPASPGEHTGEIRAEAARVGGGEVKAAGGSTVSAPLEGVRVVELALAIAAPFGTQLLAELGAEVITIQQLHDDYWMGTHFGMSCNRGKRSLALNLKTADGREVFRRLLECADVFVTNMREAALSRLGADYEHLRELNGALIYGQTRGFERGERDQLAANDQTGAALAGTEWLDGALDHGGDPLWSVTSLGDTGVGFLCAIGVVQALLHRDRTGRGQRVDSSIVYAHLLNASMAWKSSDGSAVANRPSLDPMAFGWDPLYRLYETAEGWLCLAAVAPEHWARLCVAIGRPELASDARYADAEARAQHRAELEAELAPAFASAPARSWWDALERHGVPSEITSPDSVRAVFDDPHLRRREWIKSYEHPVRGRVETAGHLIDFSDTPGVLVRPSPSAGQHSAEILSELGFDADAIRRMADHGVIRVAAGETADNERPDIKLAALHDPDTGSR